jgi:hypothetical protein
MQLNYRSCLELIIKQDLERLAFPPIFLLLWYNVMFCKRKTKTTRDDGSDILEDEQ